MSLFPMNWPYFTLEADGHLYDDEREICFPAQKFTSTEQAEKWLIDNDERGDVRTADQPRP